MKKVITKLKNLKKHENLSFLLKLKQMNSKGFSMVEIMVIVAVIGVLIMLAIPRFIGFTNNAKVTLIQSDIKTMESKVMEDMLKGLGDKANAKMFTIEKTYNLKELLGQGTVYDVAGIIEGYENEDSNYEKIANDFKLELRTSLKGDFYSNSEGKVIYSEFMAESMKDTPSEVIMFSSLSVLGGFDENQISELIKDGYIPIANLDDLKSISVNKVYTFAKDTFWEGEYIGGLGKDKAYIQVNDIDLAKIDNFEPIGSLNSEFSGTYNGGEYSIKNLKIEKPINKNIGLFGVISGSIIKNVNLKNISIYGESNVGGLVGYSNGESEIINSNVEGLIRGSKGDVGGLAGFFGFGSIINSSSNVEVISQGNRVGGIVGHNSDGKIKESSSIGSLKGKNDVGGIAGKNSGTIYDSNTSLDIQPSGLNGGGIAGNNVGEIGISYSDSIIESRESAVGGLVGLSKGRVTDSYSNGRVKASYDVGGLIGSNMGIVESSYATGLVIGGISSGTTGGLIGSNEGELVGISYYDKETSNQSDENKGKGKSTTEMKDKFNYKMWDFSKVWNISNNNYPKLR